MAIPVPSTFAAAFKAERASQPRKKRTPLLVRAGRFAARYVPTWKRVRTTVLAGSGFGFLDLAAYEVNHVLGYAAIGLSLLIVEALGGER